MAVAYSISILQEVMVFLVGCCLGSFYNVVIHRLPAGESLVSPGSRCPGCRNPIAFYDNIPIISYLLLMGKCRNCGARISVRYPVVEALTGGLALLLFLRYGFHPQFAAELFFFSLLVIIAFIDLDTGLIPNVLSLPGIAAGFIFSLLLPVRVTWTDSLAGIVIGGGLLFLIAEVYSRLRHKEGMGMGDVKLLGMIGAFIGLEGVVFTVLAASISGLIVALPVKRRMDAEIPFGPFLSLGAVCYVFWGPLFFHWYFSEMLGIG